MKRTKFAISIILFLLGYIFSGELSMLYLSNFMERYYDADFYLDATSSKISSDEMIEDFKQASDKYNVDFFIVQSSWDNSYHSEVTIIGTEGALIALKTSGIREGLNQSIFFEDAEVDFKQYQTGENMPNSSKYYFIGNKDDYQKIYDFKASLVDKYGGGFPHERGSDKETLLNLLSVWGTVFCILLFLSLYEVMLMKKEYTVRTILGESVLAIFVRNIAVDFVGFTVSFLGTGIFVSRLSNSFFKFEYVALVFALFLLFNLIIQITIFKIDYKRDLVDGNRKNSLLQLNYCIKAGTSVLMMIILSINFVTVSQAYNLYKQKAFFKDHSEYEYYSLNFTSDKEYHGFSLDEYVYRNLYATFYDKAYQYIDMTGYYNITYPMVLLNKNSFLEICESVTELKNLKEEILSQNVSILFPTKIKVNSAAYQNALEIFTADFLCGSSGEYNIEFYSGKIQLVGIHDTGSDAVYGKKLYNSPVIVVDNSKFNPNATYSYDPYYNYDVMYRLSEKEYKQFISKYAGIIEDTNKTNVLQEYKFSWSQKKQEMELSILLMLVIISIEIMMIMNTIHMEYQVNSVELALKKILGYSIFDRNKRMIWTTILSNLIGCVIGFIFSIVFKLDIHTCFFVISVMIFTAFEIICVLFYAKKSDRRNVPLVLKGERL